MSYLNIESSEKLLDSVGWEILCALQQDARMSYAEIGRRVGMSAPAVMERVRRLEDAGIITGYSARVDVSKLGLPLQAIIRVRFPGDRYPQMRKLVAETPEVLECHHVTGDDCLIMKLAVASLENLETLVGRFGTYGQTTTSVVLSSPVTERVIDRRDIAEHGNGKQ
ncbi:MAG: Lrp/AsnC family transcriptional regulator [Anaerolineae bacterium]|nr:Lrp/AsnC family transcriptional regulator [Anaerolineae bacterium]